MWAMALMLVGGVVLAFSQNIAMFITLRFIMGAALPSITLNGGLIGKVVVMSLNILDRLVLALQLDL